MNTKKAKELSKDLQIDAKVYIPPEHLKEFLNEEDKINEEYNRKYKIKKVKCVKISLAGSNNFLILELVKPRLDYVMDLFEDMDLLENGDKYEIEIFEMPEKELKELPEFDGF